MTDRSREVLVDAQGAAQKCRHASIDAPHLLLGVLRRPDTKGCQALNEAGLRYWDVLVRVLGTYEQAPTERVGQLLFTEEAKVLLESWVREVPGHGEGFVETLHLALACGRPGRWPSLDPFVTGREQAIRDVALGALSRSARREAELYPRPRPARLGANGQRRRDALTPANQIRTQRAHLKCDLRARRVSIQQLLWYPPDYIQTAKVCEILLAVPGCGRVRVDELLAQCGIPKTKTIGDLSQRQRDELAKELRSQL